MTMLKRVILLYTDYNLYRNLDWAQKGIYWYVTVLIETIPTIVRHPIYISIKLIFNIVLILLIAYVTYLYLSLEINDLYNIDKSIIELFNNVLKYIRDKLDYILNEQVVSFTEYSSISSTDTEIYPDEYNIYKNNTTSDNPFSNNTTYILMFSVITIIVVSGIIIYYNPELLNYFKDFYDDSDLDSDLLDSSSDLLGSSIPPSPTDSHYFKDLKSLDGTPKSSPSNLAT